MVQKALIVVVATIALFTAPVIARRDASQGASGGRAFAVVSGGGSVENSRSLMLDLDQEDQMISGIFEQIKDFFEGLQMDDGKSQEEVDAFLAKLQGWGGLFPKLAQRLRNDESIVRSEAVRVALAKTLEDNSARLQGDVIAHIAKYMEGVVEEDVEFLQTLGTGSVAQVVLVKIKSTEKVMKMTWPEDEERFRGEFDQFEQCRSSLPLLKMFAPKEEQAKLDRLQIFLTAVLAKKDNIMGEFNMEDEYRLTAAGADLISSCQTSLTPAYEEPSRAGTIKVPEVKSHGKHLLEQQRASGRSLAQISRDAKSLGDKTPEEQKSMTDAQMKEAEAVYYEARAMSKVYKSTFVPVLGCMLFNSGKAHADAHGGNLMFEKPEEPKRQTWKSSEPKSPGTIWVIDWGAMVELNQTDRGGLTQLISRLAREELPSLRYSQTLQNPPKPSQTLRNHPSLPTHLTPDDDPLPDWKGLPFAMWQYFFHPAGHKVPPKHNVEDLKKSIDNPQLVLCIETIHMASSMVHNYNKLDCSLDKVEHDYMGGWDYDKDCDEDTISLLTQWSSVASMALLGAAKEIVKEGEVPLAVEVCKSIQSVYAVYNPAVRFLDTQYTVLMHAVSNGDLEIVRTILKLQVSCPGCDQEWSRSRAIKIDRLGQDLLQIQTQGHLQNVWSVAAKFGARFKREGKGRMTAIMGPIAMKKSVGAHVEILMLLLDALIEMPKEKRPIELNLDSQPVVLQYAEDFLNTFKAFDEMVIQDRGEECLKEFGITAMMLKVVGYNNDRILANKYPGLPIPLEFTACTEEQCHDPTHPCAHLVGSCGQEALAYSECSELDRLGEARCKMKKGCHWDNLRSRCDNIWDLYDDEDW